MRVREVWTYLMSLIDRMRSKRASSPDTPSVPSGEYWLPGPRGSTVLHSMVAGGSETRRTHPLLATRIADKLRIPTAEVIFFWCRMGMRDYHMLLGPQKSYVWVMDDPVRV